MKRSHNERYYEELDDFKKAILMRKIDSLKASETGGKNDEQEQGGNINDTVPCMCRAVLQLIRQHRQKSKAKSKR